METKNLTTERENAVNELKTARQDLVEAKEWARLTTKNVRDAVVEIRPTGVLTVGQMAEAMGRNRNYVDAIWSAYGDTPPNRRQTRVSADASAELVEQNMRRLTDVAESQRKALSAEGDARTARNTLVAAIYRSKVLGPTPIAHAVGIDRNHVLRIARRHGVVPAWRPEGTARNQHTSN